MGFVTNGKLITENHSFLLAFASSEAQVARVLSGHADAAYAEDDDAHDDYDDDAVWVPAVEHVNDSEGEDEKLESDDEDDEVFLDADNREEAQALSTVGTFMLAKYEDV
jgi:hypothetical protein